MSLDSGYKFRLIGFRTENLRKVDWRLITRFYTFLFQRPTPLLVYCNADQGVSLWLCRTLLYSKPSETGMLEPGGLKQ